MLHLIPQELVSSRPRLGWTKITDVGSTEYAGDVLGGAGLGQCGLIFTPERGSVIPEL